MSFCHVDLSSPISSHIYTMLIRLHLDNIYVINKTYHMIHNYQPNSAQSRQRLISITVIGDTVEVVTDQSTRLYPCPDSAFAQYYARHLRRHFSN